MRPAADPFLVRPYSPIMRFISAISSSVNLRGVFLYIRSG